MIYAGDFFSMKGTAQPPIKSKFDLNIIIKRLNWFRR